LNGLRIFKRKQPWRDALIAPAGLSVFGLAASRLWSSGYHEWAFVLVFSATWLLLSISGSNVDFAEKSGVILDSVMDRNFSRMHEEIRRLEKELAEVSVRLGNGIARPERNPESSALRVSGLARSFSVSSGDD